MVHAGIYGIRNIVSKRIYVGKSKDIEGSRWPEHQYYLRRNQAENSYLQRSWNKYGEKSFELVILRDLDYLKETLSEEELHKELYRQEVEECSKHEKVYNLMPPGYGGRIHKPTNEETRERISVGVSKHWAKEGNKEKHSETHKKRYEDLNERKKTSEYVSEYWETPGAREAQSKRLTETCKRPEILELRKKAGIASAKSEYAQQKRHEAQKRRWAKPGERERTNEKRRVTCLKNKETKLLVKGV